MLFIPKSGCENEEQAKEEACILALLGTTPTLPHERVLPEPYRSTWLNAIESRKCHLKDKAQTQTFNSNSTLTTDGTTSISSGSANENKIGAVASLKLIAASNYVSHVDRRKQQEISRQARRQRERRKEAQDLANKNHTVFMSPKLRKEIEAFLRLNPIYNYEGECYATNEINEDQRNILTFLEKLGFERDVAMKSYQAVYSTMSDKSEEASLKELCLQWLCIHLEEEELPDGIDPRGRTLEVITNKVDESLIKDEEEKQKQNISEEFGTNSAETRMLSALLKQNKSMFENSQYFVRNVIVNALLNSIGCSNVDNNVSTLSSYTFEQNMEILKEETESLGLIFGNDCVFKSYEHSDNQVLASLNLENIEIGCSQTLDILIDVGLYPSNSPRYALICGKWKSEYGMFLNQKLLSFILSIPRDEPMIYSIYMQALDIIQNTVSNSSIPSFLPFIPKVVQDSFKIDIPDNHVNTPDKNHTKISENVKSNSVQNPNIRKSNLGATNFWNIHPQSFPPAQIKPLVEKAITYARERLPAAKSRPTFINMTKKMDMTGRVCLVTGETGKLL